jgi:hypothetical protein
MKMMKALLLSLASVVLFLAPVHGRAGGEFQGCSETIAAITECTVLNCPNFDQECDTTVDLDTCPEVQDACNDWVTCCGACGPEITALLATCTPGDGGTCNIAEVCPGMMRAHSAILSLTFSFPAHCSVPVLLLRPSGPLRE